MVLDAGVDPGRRIGNLGFNGVPAMKSCTDFAYITLFNICRSILENPDSHEWTVQGFGMLRLHLGNVRIHVWDDRLAYPGVSPIHDHIQWGLDSMVIAGRLTNHRYEVCDDSAATPDRMYYHVTLKPGVGTKFLEDPSPILLAKRSAEHLMAGSRYSQRPREIHRSEAVRGTVTVMLKTPTGQDEARVFWHKDEQWGTAEPRRATPEEIHETCMYSLQRWFCNESLS